MIQQSLLHLLQIASDLTLSYVSSTKIGVWDILARICIIIFVLWLSRGNWILGKRAHRDVSEGIFCISVTLLKKKYSYWVTAKGLALQLNAITYLVVIIPMVGKPRQGYYKHLMLIPFFSIVIGGIAIAISDWHQRNKDG